MDRDGKARNIANVAHFADPGLTERGWKHRKSYPLREPMLDRAGFGVEMRDLWPRASPSGARNIANVTHFGNPGLLELSSARR